MRHKALNLAGFAGTQAVMRRFGLFILAVVLSVATVVVPVKRAGHAGRYQSTAAADWQVVAAAASEAGTVAVPSKRCQSGAGSLGCPFYRPSVVVAELTAPTDVAIRFEANSPALTGRIVSPSSGPPKPFLRLT